MQTIKFDAVVQAKSIPLPEPVTLAMGQAVRVVVMFEDVQAQTPPAHREDAISRLAANPLVKADFVPLSRDEAHER